MLFELKEYQSEAVKAILTKLGRSRDDWHQHRERTAFALSSTTGSGKTVIAATVIEALLHGSDEFDVEPDPSAVVLWVSKDPALNEQTKARFIECADRIATGDLVLLDKTYADESLQRGTVYFINPDKLGKRADFVKHTDSRHVTFWEIVRNTIEDPTKTLYMVLDEAHEGMRKPSDADQTIVQRIINGNGVNPAMPIVLGISATVARFDDAMKQAKQFVKRPNVVIDPKDVQASGLLKNSLTLDIPDEDGDFVTTMVRDATIDFAGVCDRWADYGNREGLENPVLPLLVIQVPNRADGDRDTEQGRRKEDDFIHLVLEVVRNHWPSMPQGCVAHVLGDRGKIEIGQYEIPKIAPQDVQHDRDVRVLVAKDAISTGWDCPRAEVLVSLRPAEDRTYVTQLLGRMVRTPLAQTTSDERLNSASCYLPRFNRETAKVVAEEIMGMRDPDSGPPGPVVAKVLLKPVTLKWNEQIDPSVRNVLESSPSFSKPTAKPRPVKRLLKAAQALAQDELVPEADKIAHNTLFAILDDIVASNRKVVEEQAAAILTADIRRILADRGTAEATSESIQRDADAATVDDALRHLRRLITTSVVNRYLARNMQSAIDELEERGDDPSAVDINAVRAEVAALGLIDAGVQAEIEDAADSLTRHWLSTNVHAIKGLPDSRQPTYDAIKDLARFPERTMIEIKDEDIVDSVDTDGSPLETTKFHVLSDGNGDYPLDIKLNRWERAAIRKELPNAAAWYRNPSSAGKHSLRIPYEDGDSWKSLQPDLVFISAESGASIIDPHGAHLGDASPKLKALAQYADEFGDQFERIVAIGVEKDGILYGIDLLKPVVRKAVYESPADTESLKQIFEKHGEPYAETD